MLQCRLYIFAIFVAWFVLLEPVWALEKEKDLRLASIPQSPTATTWKHRAARQKVWAKRVLVDPMRTRIQGKTWSEEAIGFAEEAALTMIQPAEERDEELFEQGRSLINKGCKDPLVLFFTGRLAPRDQKDLKLSCFREALPLIENEPGPKSLHWLLLYDLASTLDVFAHVHRETLQFVPVTWAMLKDGSFREDEQELLLAQLLRDSYFVRRNPDMFMGLAETPDLPSWFRKTLMGWVHWQRAVRLRNGWPQTGASASDMLRYAESSLTEAWQERPSVPLAAIAMISVSYLMGDTDGTDSRIWFDRAVSAEFDNILAYQLLGSIFSPEGVGDVELLLKLAELCRQTGRMDTVVPRYFFAYTQIAVKFSPSWKAIYRRPEISKGMIELSQERAKDRNESQESMSFLAVNAWLAGDFKLASDAYEKIGRKLVTAAKTKLANLDIHNFEQELSLLGNKTSADYLEIQRLAKEPDKVALKTALKEAVNRNTGTDSKYFATQLALVEFEEKYQTGDWVSLPTDPKSPCWGIQIKDDSVVVYPPPVPAESLNFAFPIGENFEISAVLRADPTSNKNSTFFFATLATRTAGDTPPYPDAKPFLELEMDHSGMSPNKSTNTHSVIRKGAMASGEISKTFELAAENTIIFRLQNDAISVNVNGAPLHREVPLFRKPNGEMLFGLKLPPRTSGAIVDLKIRKLVQPPQSPQPFSFPESAEPNPQSKKPVKNEA